MSVFNHKTCLDFSFYPKKSCVSTIPKNHLLANFTSLLCITFPIFETVYLYSQVYDNSQLHFRSGEKVLTIWQTFDRFILDKVILFLTIPKGTRFLVVVFRPKKKVKSPKILIDNLPSRIAALPDLELLKALSVWLIDPSES
eukprot:TRINITY_DN1763_c0_g1_i2.p1 TRINITY_DN1763_c0_g1~~TRINITY_DN1763_c0_g1_i2.p1  ORF type:complete len:151 (-),score=10.04 TRINITY_DN1763_c0_g1_i2:247-672(-)